MYPEFVQMKAERGFSAAVHAAASRNRLTASEWMRQALRQALQSSGVELPPFPNSNARSLQARN